MKKSFLFAALLSLISFAQAAPNKAPTLKVIKPLVMDYLNATGCPDGEIDPKLVSKFSDKANQIDGYIAVVFSDVSCAGGSGTSAATLVVLRTASGREGIDDPSFSYLKVDLGMSEPSATSNSPARFLTSIYQKDGQLFATSLEYGKDDAQCCPSVKSLYKISLSKKTVALSKDDKRDLYTWIYSPVKK